MLVVVESGAGVGKGKEVREVFGTEGEYPPLQRILSALHLFQDTVFPASNSLPFFHPNLFSSNVVPFYLVVLTTSRTPLLRSSDPLSVSRQASFVLPFLPLSLFLFPSSSSPFIFDVAAYNSVFLLLTFFLRLPFFFSCLPLSFFFCLLPRHVSPPFLIVRASCMRLKRTAIYLRDSETANWSFLSAKEPRIFSLWKATVIPEYSLLLLPGFTQIDRPRVSYTISLDAR